MYSPPIKGQTIQLRYIGTRPGNAPFYGAVSRLQYRFGRGQDTGFVHVDDVPAFLAMRGIDKFERVDT